MISKPPNIADVIDSISATVRGLMGRLGSAEQAIVTNIANIAASLDPAATGNLARIWVQTSDPGAAARNGDIWIKSGRPYVRQSGAWVGVYYFVQSSDPGAAANEGDIWIQG